MGIFILLPYRERTLGLFGELSLKRQEIFMRTQKNSNQNKLTSN